MVQSRRLAPPSAGQSPGGDASPMKLQTEEAEEPPSRPQVAHQLLPNPHRPINALTPAVAPSLGSGLGMLATRGERFPVGPRTRAFRKRYFPEVDPAQWNDWRWHCLLY